MKPLPRSFEAGAERTCARLLAAAAGWSLLLFALAVAVPVETVDTGRPGVQPMRSWVAVNGFDVMGFVAIPLAVTLVVGLLLTGARRHRSAHVAAWGLAAALLVAAMVGSVTLFLISIYVLPAAGLLLAACGVSGPERRR